MLLLFLLPRAEADGHNVMALRFKSIKQASTLQDVDWAAVWMPHTETSSGWALLNSNTVAFNSSEAGSEEHPNKHYLFN